MKIQLPCLFVENVRNFEQESKSKVSIILTDVFTCTNKITAT